MLSPDGKDRSLNYLILIGNSIRKFTKTKLYRVWTKVTPDTSGLTNTTKIKIEKDIRSNEVLLGHQATE